MLILIIALIQLPSVQNYLTQKSINYLENKIHTEVRLDKIYIGFPKSIVLEGLYIEDQQKDTLVDLEYLSVDMEMWALFNKNIEINSLTVNSLNSNIYTRQDSQYNFQYIIDAFSGSGKNTSTTSNASSTNFTIKDVDLENVRFDFDDKLNGIFFFIRTGKLNLVFDDFDATKSIYHADHIQLSNTHFKFIQRASQISDKEEGGMPDLDIAAGELVLDQVSSQYISETSGQDVQLDIGNIKLIPDKINLKDQLIAIEKLDLQNSEIVYRQKKITDQDSLINTEAVSTNNESTATWQITVKQVHGKNNAFQYENDNYPIQEEGIDYYHMNWSNLGFDIHNITFNYPRILAEIKSLQGEESSGFIVKQLNTDFQMDESSITASNLKFISPNSDIQLKADLQFQSITEMTEKMGATKVQLDLDQSTFGFRDILYIQSNLKNTAPFQGNRNKSIHLKGNLKGKIADLKINKLIASYGSATQLKANGTIKGLPDIDSTQFNIQIPSMLANRKEVRQLLPKGSLPESINLPESFRAQGNFNGSINNFTTQFKVDSDLGVVKTKAQLQTMRQTPNYTAEIILEDFDVGALLGDTITYGTTSLQSTLEGQYLEWEKLQANATAHVKHFRYNEYSYQNLELNARIEKEVIELKGNIKDSNLIADINANADLNIRPMEFKGNINIEGVNLQKLNFTEEDIRTRGLLSFNVKGSDPDSLKGHVSVSDMLIIKKGKQYFMDTMYASVNTMDTVSRLELYSDFLQGHIEGNVDPKKFAHVFRHHLDHYLDTRPVDSLREHVHEQEFDFQFKVEQSVLLTNVLLPGLEKLQQANISGTYSSRKHNMNVEGYFPKIVYNGIIIDSLDININSDAQAMNFEVSSQSIQNPNIQIENPVLAGNVHNRTLNVSLNIAEDTAYQNLYLAGALTMVDSNYHFSFNQDGVVLDNEKWSVQKDHYIQFGPGGLNAKNFEVSNNHRSIALKQNENEAFVIDFKNFSLQDISQAFKKDQELVTGIMNGTVTIQNSENGSIYNADIIVDKLKVLESPIGQLSLNAKNTQKNTIQVDATAGGNNNDISINGQYHLDDASNALDFDIDVNRLNMKSLEAFTGGRLEDMEGYLTGDLDITGPITKPIVTGQLNFENTQVRVSQLHTRYRITDQSISFNRDVVRFNNFTIQDTLGNEAQLNGTVSMEDLRNPKFQLDARTNEFLLLDKPNKRGALFYGELRLNSDIKVRGSLNRPDITATAEIVQGSDVAMVIPSDDPSLETEGGIDEFIDRDQKLNPIMQYDERTDTVTSEIKGIDLRANLSIKRNSEIQIFLDRGRGNYLKVKGDADLVFSMDPGGQITLTGRYDIYDGQYQLLFRNVVKRTFDLQEGSSIVWTGDPMRARVNLSAVHVKQAEPIGLVQDQLAQDDQAAINRFKQSLPFQIQLSMKEELISPYIDFDITLPQQQQGALGGQVQAKLNQLNQNESEVNKQVFALLVLGRFIPDDPFNVSGGSTAEAAARRSVSKLLNAQLDKFSDRYIDAFELDLSLESYEDYSTGQAQGRTELNIGINKAFFNDRLTVRIGGNVDLEGDRSRNQQAADLIGDISVEYALTEDGTWRLRAFRKNEYEGIIDGDIIKTGTSLIFSKDYNTIRELFGQPKKENKEK